MKSLRRLIPMLVATTLLAGCGVGTATTGLSGKSMTPKRENFFSKMVNPAYEREINQQIIAVTQPGQAVSVPGAKEIERLPYGALQLVLLEVEATRNRDQVIGMLAQVPGVQTAQPNVLLQPQDTLDRSRLPKDEMMPMQWALPKMQASEAWQTTRGRKNVVVAVLDTGIDYTHPEFEGRLIKGPNFAWVPPAPVPPGLPPRPPAGPFPEPSGPDDPLDDVGHGTHVAGIIAAAADGKGIVGVAPNVTIMAIKVLGKQGGSFWSIAQGVQYAYQHGAQVINMSLGGVAPGETLGNFDLLSLMCEEARRQGTLVIAAAGNDGLDMELLQRTGKRVAPAMFPSVLSVGATREDDSLAPFSNRGRPLGITAPGYRILSTTPSYPTPMSQQGMSPYYDTMSGTSMAAPYAAGLAALLYSQHPDWTPDQVEAQMRKTADDLGNPGRDDTYGSGRINVLKALAQ